MVDSLPFQGCGAPHLALSFLRRAISLLCFCGRPCAGIELAGEEDAGEGPVALDGARGDLEEGSDLFDGETAEVAELDDAGLAGIVRGEAGEGLIDGGDFVEAIGGDGEVVVHFDAVEASGASLGVVLAGGVAGGRGAWRGA